MKVKFLFLLASLQLLSSACWAEEAEEPLVNDEPRDETVNDDKTKNTISAYIMYIGKIKSKLSEEKEAVSKVTTEEQRKELLRSAEAGEEWLKEGGFDADLETIEEKMAELSKPAEKVWSRVEEFTKRPEASKDMRKHIAKLAGLLNYWKESKPQITKEERDEVNAKVEEAYKWIDEKDAEQAEKEAHEEPVYHSWDVPVYLEPLIDLVKSLHKKKDTKNPEKKKELKNPFASFAGREHEPSKLAEALGIPKKAPKAAPKKEADKETDKDGPKVEVKFDKSKKKDASKGDKNKKPQEFDPDNLEVVQEGNKFIFYLD